MNYKQIKIMSTEIIITLITTLSGLLTLLIKQHYDHKVSLKNQKGLTDLITDKDKKQDAELEKLNIKVDSIYNFVDRLEYKKHLIIKIRKVCNTTISANSLDNKELITMLNNTRDKFISVIETIVDTEIKDLKVNDIKNDIFVFAKYVKTITNFDCIDVKKKEVFYDRLKKEVVLPNIEVFLMRLEDEVIHEQNKYNGTFEKITVGLINNIITSIIRIYRDTKNL